MILVDVNILSTFARVGGVELVRKLFREESLFLTPACLNEARRAVEVGCDFLRPVLEAVESGAGFDIVPLTKDELLLLSSLPASLGAGERESLAVCSRQRGAKLLTNDRRARNFCRERAIPCLDLPGLLRALWKRGLRSKREVRDLMTEMERGEGIVFKDKESVFR